MARAPSPSHIGGIFLHFASSGSVCLLERLGRASTAWSLPDRGVAQALPAVLAFAAISPKDVCDVVRRGWAWKAVLDWASWLAGFLRRRPAQRGGCAENGAATFPSGNGGEGVLARPSKQCVCERHGTEDLDVTLGGLVAFPGGPGITDPKVERDGGAYERKWWRPRTPSFRATG